MYQKGGKSAGCTTNQMRDYAKKTSGQWNKWGLKMEYGFPKTKVNRFSECDPLMPGKCPKKMNTCVKYTVLDADLSNDLFMNYMILYPGMLKPGKSSYLCMDGKDAREVIQSGGRNEEAMKTMGWNWKAKVIKGKRGGKKGGKGMKGMKGDDDDDNDWMDSAMKLGASAAVAVATATLF